MGAEMLPKSRGGKGSNFLELLPIIKRRPGGNKKQTLQKPGKPPKNTRVFVKN